MFTFFSTGAWWKRSATDSAPRLPQLRLSGAHAERKDVAHNIYASNVGTHARRQTLALQRTSQVAFFQGTPWRCAKRQPALYVTIYLGVNTQCAHGTTTDMKMMHACINQTHTHCAWRSDWQARAAVHSYLQMKSSSWWQQARRSATLARQTSPTLGCLCARHTGHRNNTHHT